LAKVPLKSREDLSEDGQQVFDKIVGTRGRALNVFRALLNSLDTASAVAGLGEYIRYNSKLDPAIRETAILATARELGAEYEWAHHEPAAREAGVRDVVIESIRSGKAPMGLPPKEGVFVQAAKELTRGTALTDRTHQAIEHLLGPAGTVELIVIIGYYSMLARVIATLDIELDEGVASTW
jgi:4-carboxymuconolactone decarboxylase